MQDWATVSQMGPSLSPRPATPKLQSFSDYSQVIEAQASGALFKEVASHVDARILKKAGLDPRYAQLRARRRQRDLYFDTDALSVPGDYPNNNMNEVDLQRPDSLIGVIIERKGIYALSSPPG
jgi:hypothetical protein